MTKVNTSRRDFLIRALGVTAAGATTALPIVKVAGASVLTEHHLKEPVPAIQEGGYWHFPGS